MEGFSKAQWSAILDSVTCGLCGDLDGKILNGDNPEMTPPTHLNCRCVLIPIGDREVDPETGQPYKSDFKAPDQALIDKFGHFVTDPEKYSEIKLPSTPQGRLFIVRRVKSELTGEVKTFIDWRVKSAVDEVRKLLPAKAFQAWMAGRSIVLADTMSEIEGARAGWQALTREGWSQDAAGKWEKRPDLVIGAKAQHLPDTSTPHGGILT